jgi:hypothetical protein
MQMNGRPLLPAPVPHRLARRLRQALAAVATLVLTGNTGAVAAGQAPASGGGIYTCIDDNGRRLTADRPIPECSAKEQRVLNKDGSVKGVHPPSLTAEERAELEARERRAAEARAAQIENARRDRNLVQRYRNEESHRRAREAALDTVRAAIRVSELRLADLERERKPLMDEVEFYKGRAIPSKLRQKLEANDAAVEAQRVAAATQQAELDRITALYDAELERLKRLWAGAAPGSMGPLVAGPPPATAAVAPAAVTPSAPVARP